MYSHYCQWFLLTCIQATVGCTGAIRSLNNKSRALVCAQLNASAVIGRAGASPPSRTAAIIFLIYIFIYIFTAFVRRALNLLRASFSPIFQYFSAVNVTRVSFSPIIQYFLTCIAS